METIIYRIQEMREAVIKAGGQPNTLRISKEQLEGSTIFGMKIIVVDSLPNDSFLMVSDDRSIRNGNTKNS